MVTELVTFKLDKNFLKDVDVAVKNNNFSNRTDFIRDALREKLEKIRYNYAVLVLSKLKGSSKTKTTEEEYERIRIKVTKQFLKFLNHSASKMQHSFKPVR